MKLLITIQHKLLYFVSDLKMVISGEHHRRIIIGVEFADFVVKTTNLKLQQKPMI